MKREEEERENWKSKNSVTERLIDLPDLIQRRGLYSLTKCVKYQKYLKYMITIGTKWELYKMRSFGTKTQREDFRYAMNFAIIGKISL